MTKLRLLSAASALTMGLALAGAPAMAFDEVHWSWSSDTDTGLDAYFDIKVDFDPSGLTQTERLQVMAGNMTAVADGSGATYFTGGERDGKGVVPVIIRNTFAPEQSIEQKIQSRGETEVELSESLAVVKIESESEASQTAANKAVQNLTINIDTGDVGRYAPPLDAVEHLGKVEIAATAASNIATIDSEHATFAHDAQIAFGDFKSREGRDYGEHEFPNGGDVASGNRNYDVLTQAMGWAKAGQITKGYNSAMALGDNITNAQASVDATAASNIHTVAVKPLEIPEEKEGYHHWHGGTDSDNIAVLDLNQFGYSDNFAYATATNHTVGGFKNLGLLEAPVLKVSATALGNVSSVTNKFGGAAD